MSSVITSNNKVSSPYKRLLKEAFRYWPMLLLGFSSTFVVGGVDAGLTWLIKPVINKGFIDKDKTFIQLFPLCILLLFSLRAAFGFASNYCISRVGQNVIMNLRQAIFKHLVHLPVAFFDKQSSGKLLSVIIYNVSSVSRASTDALLVLLTEGATVVGCVVLMFVLAWKLSCIFLLSIPFILLMVRYVSRRSRRISAETQRTLGEVSHIAEEAISGYKVIRTFGGEQYEVDKFNQATRQNRQLDSKTVITSALGSSIVQLLIALPFALAVFLATVTQITAGSIIAVIVCMFRISAPMRRLTRINAKIQQGIAGAESVFKLLDAPLEADAGRMPLARAKGMVEFRQVSFNYPGFAKKVLNNINFTVKPGQTVALVGYSGSGKSTLVKLLPRFYSLNTGEVRIDGVNSNDYRLSDLRQQFAFVSQDVVLFNDTIANNIAYAADSHAPNRLEAIERAAKAAYALEFIEKMPQGFDTVVGEGGVLLSGGQRQRLAIARAIFRDAPILILDEATSALDTLSEQYIQSALPELVANRTTFVIAHRLSTIESADCIFVLQEGNLVEQGTHTQLLEKEGVYAQLYKVQFAKRTQPKSILAEAVAN